MAEIALDNVHPEAALELEAGLLWYRERSRRAAERFLSEIERAVGLIVEAPNRWPTYLYGARRYVLFKYPYSIIYGASPDRITLYAFAHAKRRPGYWKGRLG